MNPTSINGQSFIPSQPTQGMAPPSASNLSQSHEASTEGAHTRRSTIATMLALQRNDRRSSMDNLRAGTHRRPLHDLTSPPGLSRALPLEPPRQTAHTSFPSTFSSTCLFCPPQKPPLYPNSAEQHPRQVQSIQTNFFNPATCHETGHVHSEHAHSSTLHNPHSDTPLYSAGHTLAPDKNSVVMNPGARLYATWPKSFHPPSASPAASAVPSPTAFLPDLGKLPCLDVSPSHSFSGLSSAVAPTLSHCSSSLSEISGLAC